MQAGVRRGGKIRRKRNWKFQQSRNQKTREIKSAKIFVEWTTPQKRQPERDLRRGNPATKARGLAPYRQGSLAILLYEEMVPAAQNPDAGRTVSRCISNLSRNNEHLESAARQGAD